MRNSISRRVFLLLLLLASLVSTALPQNRVPRFKEYPVDEIYKEKNAPLVLTQKDREFRTKLREAANEKPNFAGHYILTTWGCGAECVMGALVDAKTGKVYWLPHTICCWGNDVDDKFNPVEFRLESKLVVFSGLRNEKEGDNGAHFYKFDDGRFTHIYSAMKK